MVFKIHAAVLITSFYEDRDSVFVSLSLGCLLDLFIVLQKKKKLKKLLFEINSFVLAALVNNF